MMLDTELRNDDLNGDPAPCYATDAEIEIAQQLRHQLERRYLSHGTLPLEFAICVEDCF
jgi:hypothetical protein